MEQKALSGVDTLAGLQLGQFRFVFHYENFRHLCSEMVIAAAHSKSRSKKQHIARYNAVLVRFTVSPNQRGV